MLFYMSLSASQPPLVTPLVYIYFTEKRTNPTHTLQYGTHITHRENLVKSGGCTDNAGDNTQDTTRKCNEFGESPTNPPPSAQSKFATVLYVSPVDHVKRVQFESTVRLDQFKTNYRIFLLRIRIPFV